MRNLIFLVLIFASCQSEPVSEPESKGYGETLPPCEAVWIPGEEWPRIEGGRDGVYYPLFYKESLTTDNYLVTPTFPRTQMAYNKAKVDSIYMTRVGNNTLNIDGINHGFYDVRIKHVNQATGDPIRHISVVGAATINYKPYGANVLHSSNTAKVIRVIRTNEKQLYPDWFIGRLKNKWKYTVMADTTSLGQDFIQGSTPTGAAFLMPHK